MDALSVTRELSRAASQLRFAEPVTHVYNPLVHASKPNRKYLRAYCTGRKRAIFVGVNPGPWGMVQTGVPFGDVTMVRDWLGIEESVSRPAKEHPKRPVQGFACERREVSGTRFWGWARDRFGTPGRFFKDFFVWNYCPLSFMVESGRNFTPDKLPASERRPLFEVCDTALVAIVEHLDPEWVIGVGKFAEDRATAALHGADVRIGRILHPSPASPLANKDWAGTAEATLARLGVL